ncbi:MAG: TIGR03668 family PPOX class F420-dependent oxidoreductase [Actinomycetota bacterium]|nr:TIGR03668 family PPOX class F420-dependent oxidoreductase [Actinomycetota bacterium]
MDPETMRRLVAEARVGRVATIDPDGKPNVVPFCFVLAGDTLYTSVDHKPKEGRRLRRVENLQRDPRVTVLVDHYEEDWPRVWWVRARGTGRVVDDAAEVERGNRLLAEKYAQYADDPPPGPILAIEISEWRGWSYSPIQ